MDSNKEKIKALHDFIIEECKRQNFSIAEFEQLILDLGTTLYYRQHEIKQELLWRINFLGDFR